MNSISKKIKFCDLHINNSSKTESFFNKHGGRNSSVEKIINKITIMDHENVKDIEELANILIDLRLQQYFIEDSTPKIMARFMDEKLDITKDSFQFLSFMNLIQVMIIQVMIIQGGIYIEKIINFVHFYVTGNPYPRDKKKEYFFKNILTKDSRFIEWKFMKKWKSIILTFDKLWRNFEIHSGSNLTKFLFFNNQDSALISFCNQIKLLQNNVFKTFWNFTNRIIDGDHILEHEIDNLNKQKDNALNIMRIVLDDIK